MLHLHSFRQGWQSEHLAMYILSKCSFLAQPITSSDDLGSDFFGTRFRIDKNGVLLPKYSYAIQIKSKGDIGGKRWRMDVTRKTDYLSELEIPFFLGVVDRRNLTLGIYSGEAIPHFFALYGNPTSVSTKAQVFIKLTQDYKSSTQLTTKARDKYLLIFPKILDLSAHFDYEKSGSRLAGLFELCGLIQNNIASRRNHEYIYKYYKKNGCIIYTGPGSATAYMENYFARLAEVFYNMSWLRQNSKPVSDKEFSEFEQAYLWLNNRYSLPDYLMDGYKKAKALFP